ncbi:MAG: FumA C-terminus/TtdB family hydratase beta subunit [Desulfurococcales archaeon]|nr:FumA C-terminus/TtdB family hydratase beta subunit [Desulfurococcales archaeon]
MSGREYRLRTPLSVGDVERLRVGDIVYLSGLIFTARDEAHKKILEEIESGRELPFNPEGLALYHCGPVARRLDGGWEIIAAGPTTSMRMESVEAEFIEKTGVRMIIGKGGMGERTADAMRRHKAVYTVFTGGAGALAAEAIKRVIDVYWLEELGIPEAVWLLEVEDFGPLIVTIDTTGRNYYEERRREVLRRAEEVISELASKKLP